MSTNKAPRNALERILRGVLVGANLGTILLLWMSVLSTYLPPDLFPRLSLAGACLPRFSCGKYPVCLLMAHLPCPSDMAAPVGNDGCGEFHPRLLSDERERPDDRQQSVRPVP